MEVVIPKVVCPWCVSEMRSKSAYKDRTVYYCPHCTKAFQYSDGKALRSDGSSRAAKALALLLALVVGVPLLFFFCSH